MNRRSIGACALVMAVLASACAGAASSPTSAPTPVNTPTATSAPQATATPTSLEPCDLIPSEEASALAGTTYAEGMEGTTPGGGKTCTYGAGTLNVFTVEVAQAPDVETAQAYKTQFVADLEAKLQELASTGITVTELPDFADGAVVGQATFTVAGTTINGSGFGFLKGTIFVGFSDVVVGGTAPTNEALQSEAETVLERLP